MAFGGREGPPGSSCPVFCSLFFWGWFTPGVGGRRGGRGKKKPWPPPPPVSIWCGKASKSSPSRSPTCRRRSRTSSTECQHLHHGRPLPRHAIPCCDRRKRCRCVDPPNGSQPPRPPPITPPKSQKYARQQT